MMFRGILICFMSLKALSSSANIADADSNLPYPNHIHQTELQLALPYVMVNIHEEDTNKSVNFAAQIMDGMSRLETNLDWSNIHIQRESPSHGQLIDSAPEAEALKQGKAALVAAKATMQLMSVHCPLLDGFECIKHISQLSMKSTSLYSSCPEKLHFCTAKQLNSPYYSLDGSCNNKMDGLLGKSFSGYKRILPANYMDSIQEPRSRSVQKRNFLPSPRLISTTLCEHRSIEDNEKTLAVMQWAQFIEHDLAHTAISKMVHSNKTIECCDPDGYYLAPRYMHPLCQPISIPEDDIFYSKYGTKCMPYIRSILAMQSHCKFGAVDQINQATHFLDGSQLYGSDLNRSNSLRKFERGLLKSRTIGQSEFLLQSENPVEDCQFYETSCYLSGDSRVNSQPQLTAMYLLWHREHNRIATTLASMHGKWDDEQLFQEARKIVIAEMQHITYYEWLPAILGKRYASKIQQSNFYSVHVDPRVSNSFATAGIRSINSLIADKLNLYSEDREVQSILQLKEHFNKPQIVEDKDTLNGLVRGLATQRSQKLDLDYVEDITTSFYNSGKYGFDILSLDIQRGRDHGLPTYLSVRSSLCRLPKVKEFSELSNMMELETIGLLKNLYQTPEDIDLLVGGMSEMPDGDSLLGPTLSCIIADQLLRTRQGDRNFYDNIEQPEPFTKAQREEIQKSSLARIFCDNSDQIKFMQRNIFKNLSETNQLLACYGKGIPRVDLKHWETH